MKKLNVAGLVFVLLILVCVCGQPEVAWAKTAAPQKIVLNLKKKTLYAGEKLQLSVKGNARVKWSVNHRKAATISKTGVVTAKPVKKTTKVTVTAAYAKNKKVKAKAVITVKKGVKNKSITLNKRKHTMTVGQSITLKVSKWNPKKTTVKRVTWTSGNKSIASVSSKGVVKARTKGKVTITATNTYGKKAVCKFTVKPKSQPVPPAEPVEVQTQTFSFTVFDDIGTVVSDVSCQLSGISAKSNSKGLVRFDTLENGNYTLKVDSPLQYDVVTYSVVVSTDGIMVDGQTPGESFNVRLRRFCKDLKIPVDSYKNVGGEFGLYQNNKLVQTSHSAANDNMLVYRNIPSGTYILKQTSRPANHKAYGLTHTIIIDRSQTTLDGQPAYRLEYLYQSARPTVNDIKVGQNRITGTGIPGSTIQARVNVGVNLSGSLFSTTVKADGTWEKTISDKDVERYITANNTISFQQEEVGYLESETLYVTVKNIYALIKLRVIDGETGLPVSGIVFQMGSISFNTATSDANGIILYGIALGDCAILYRPDSGSPYTWCEADNKNIVLHTDETITIDGVPVTGIYDLVLRKAQ